MSKAAIRYNIRSYYTTFATMIETFILTKFKDEERRNMNRLFESVDLLVIDDVGNEFRQSFGKQQEVTAEARGLLDSVLRARRGRSTFLTTNKGMDGLKLHYGSNVVSLLSQFDCRSYEGDDFRESKKNRDLVEARQGLMRPITFGVGT
jgi:DNA replication protein DnaC